MKHNVIGVTGQFGSGKTLHAVERAIKFCNFFQKRLVVNFPINHKAAREYARYMGYHWFAGNAFIYQIETSPDDPATLMRMFDKKDSVVVIDEGGVFLNARFWKVVGRDFLQNLFQIRHLNIHLFLVFQFHDQVDKQFRMIIQEWERCDSWGFYDKKLKLPRIIARFVYRYKVEKFLLLEENTAKRANILWPWFLAESVSWRLFVFNQLFAMGRTVLNELAYALVYIVSSRHIKRKRYFSQEDKLFAIFSSNHLVGSSARRPVAPFLTESDYERFRLRSKAATNGSNVSASVFFD